MRRARPVAITGRHLVDWAVEGTERDIKEHAGFGLVVGDVGEVIEAQRGGPSNAPLNPHSTQYFELST